MKIKNNKFKSKGRRLYNNFVNKLLYIKNKMKSQIKRIGIMLSGGVMILGAIASFANADCKVYGNLQTSVHYVSILKDSATASTSVTSGGKDVEKVKNQTTVYAYKSDGSYTTDTNSCSGAGAMEGWGGQATASINAMVKAKGIHKGKNGTTSEWLKATTSWNK